MSEGERIALALFLVFIGIIVIVVHIYISLFFGNIAEEKGYDKMRWFWCVFFLGIVGMLMVIALLDNRSALAQTSTQEHEKKKPSSSIPVTPPKTTHTAKPSQETTYAEPERPVVTDPNAFVSGRQYSNGDIVKFEGKWYVCCATSGSVWSPKQSPAQWEEVEEAQ